MRLVFACAFALVSLVACSDGDDAQRVLYDAGYKQVRITGWQMWGCADGDTFATGFEAVGPSGNAVRGVVCRGWFKGSTVRLQ